MESKTYGISEKTNKYSITIDELSKDINAKLDQIHAVLGYILEKTNILISQMPKSYKMPDESTMKGTMPKLVLMVQ